MMWVGEDFRNRWLQDDFGVGDLSLVRPDLLALGPEKQIDEWLLESDVALRSCSNASRPKDRIRRCVHGCDGFLLMVYRCPPALALDLWFVIL